MKGPAVIVPAQTPYPHSGKPQPPLPQPPRGGASQIGTLSRLLLCAAGTLSSFSNRELLHSGHAGRSAPRTSSSNVAWQLWQVYS